MPAVSLALLTLQGSLICPTAKQDHMDVGSVASASHANTKKTDSSKITHRCKPHLSSTQAILSNRLPSSWSVHNVHVVNRNNRSHGRKTSRTNTQGFHLWSAVALQQHVLQTGPNALPLARYPVAAAQLLSHTSPASSLVADGWTLAQKMGLVAPPAPAPTQEDWAYTEFSAIQREEEQEKEGPHAGSSVCAICCEAFDLASDQGQVILGCSHVFHERCFTRLERFARRHLLHGFSLSSPSRSLSHAIPRSVWSAAPTVTPLTCPVCRHTAKHKRIYYASQARRQCAAVVRIQAAVRGFCARRRYVRYRLRVNEHFRRDYVEARLQRLSQALEVHVQRHDAEREALLGALEVRHAAAMAAYWVAEDWNKAIRLCVLRGRQAARERRHDVGAVSSESTQCADDTANVRSSRNASESAVTRKHDSGAQDDEKSDMEEYYECPICMEAIERGLHDRHADGCEQSCHKNMATIAPTTQCISCINPRASSRDAHRASEACCAKVKTICTLPSVLRTRRSARRMGRCEVTREHADSSTAHRCGAVGMTDRIDRNKSVGYQLHQKTNVKERTGMAKGIKREHEVICAPDAESNRVRTERCGMLLSCGHCFHRACLAAFERYVAMDALEHRVSEVCPSCPTCRSGYATHPF